MPAVAALPFGDLVVCETQAAAPESARSIADELGLSLPDDELLCGEVALARPGGGRVHVELLRSRSWWEHEGLASGVIALDLPELGISGAGTLVRTWAFDGAQELGDEHARPATARFVTDAAATLRIELSSGEVFEATGRHPFWSVTRGAWVPAAGLVAGEVLDGAAGAVKVASVAGTGARVPVYNLEVAGAHTYRVGVGGVLVHNNCRVGNLPSGGKPNSSLAEDIGNGKGTIRDYGPDGKAKTDYDFGHDHGGGDPHAHDWDWSQPGSERQRGRPLRPGE